MHRFTSKAAELKVNPTPKPVKIPKEPKTPKRAAAPLNAYTLFVKEAFPGIRQQNPAAKLSDVSPVWKSLSAAEREKCAPSGIESVQLGSLTCGHVTFQQACDAPLAARPAVLSSFFQIQVPDGSGR